MGNTGIMASTTWTTWSKLEQTAGANKPAMTAKSNNIANMAASMPPLKPYNGYKMVQKLVQLSGSSGSSNKPSSQQKQTTCLPDHNNSISTTTACFECGQTRHLLATKGYGIEI